MSAKQVMPKMPLMMRYKRLQEATSSERGKRTFDCRQEVAAALLLALPLHVREALAFVIDILILRPALLWRWPRVVLGFALALAISSWSRDLPLLSAMGRAAVAAAVAAVGVAVNGCTNCMHSAHVHSCPCLCSCRIQRHMVLETILEESCHSKPSAEAA